jgi:hypothetical protein
MGGFCLAGREHSKAPPRKAVHHRTALSGMEWAGFSAERYDVAARPLLLFVLSG